jgi:hypothetical protein
MTPIKLILYKSIGPIKLGASRDEVIGILGAPDYSESSIFGLEEFHSESFFRVQYSSKTKLCNNIGLSYPAELWYEGIDILGLSWENAVDWIKTLDPSIQIRDDGYPPDCISHSLGLSMCAKDDYDHQSLIVDTLTLFSSDCWDNFEEKSKLFEENLLAGLPSDEECAR